MTRKSRVLWRAVAVFLTVAVAVTIYAMVAPPGQSSSAFAGAVECALRQKDLFGWVEAYREEYGHLPDSVGTLLRDKPRAQYCSGCPFGPMYVLHPENYGNPKGVLISESENKHPFSLQLWLRRASPHVQTMGDGTVYPFANGKFVSFPPEKDRGR